MVGYRGGIPRVGPVGDFHGVAEPVPVVVGIEMIFYAVAVQVLHHIGHGDGEGFLQRGVLVVGHLYPYVEGGVCLVIEDRRGADGAVGIKGEE